MNDLIVKHFDGRPVAFRSENGKLCLTPKEIGEVLGYKQPGKSVDNLYNEHKDEFDNDCTQITVSVNRDGYPPQRERIFYLDGLILLCMFSEQPIAKKVRRWLRKIGREVAITGQYLNPDIQAQFLQRTQAAFQTINQNLEALHSRLMLVEIAQAQTLIPAPADNRSWPTPTQRLKTISNGPFPKYFNRGGSFDVFVCQRHALLRGGLLSQRDRAIHRKMPDYVIQPCPENDEFLRDCFRTWKSLNPQAQRSLNLRPIRSAS
ncbi:MAG: BRO family protein [bacterium]